MATPMHIVYPFCHVILENMAIFLACFYFVHGKNKAEQVFCENMAISVKQHGNSC